MSRFTPAEWELAKRAEEKIKESVERIDYISRVNTERVLDAFARHRVSDACFAGTTGYGYDDMGREKLEAIYADVFGCEKALVRTTFVNGTHAIGCAMFGCVSPGQTMLSITGDVYDTLQTLTGQRGKVPGSFADYGIGFRKVDMKDGRPDLSAITKAVAEPDVAAVFVQRSRGYGIRDTLSPQEIGELCTLVKSIRPEVVVMVDNSYGEFADVTEPTHHGADLICASLIKNPGGGLAPSGGYIAGRADLVERAAARMSVPGIGGECGLTFGQTRTMFQGMFQAPKVVNGAVKGAILCGKVYEKLGY